MRFHGMSIRTKMRLLVSLPLVTLCGLWAFSLNGVVGDVSALRAVGTSYEQFTGPLGDLTQGMQDERLAAVEYLARPGTASARTTLLRAEARTDRLVAVLRGHARQASSDDLQRTQRAALDEITEAVEQLPGIRAGTVDRSLSAAAVTERYSRLISTSFRFRPSFTALQTGSLAQRTSVLMELVRGREYIAQEEAALAGMAGLARPSHGQYRLLDEAVEARRLFFNSYLSRLEGRDRDAYGPLLRSKPWSELANNESRFLAVEHGPIEQVDVAGRWRAAAHQVTVDLGRINRGIAQGIGDHAKSQADDLISRNAIVGAVSLAAVVVSITVSSLVGRRLVGDLLRLRDSARDLAHVRLPQVLRRLRKGEKVDVDAAAPPLPGWRHELGEVGHAFHAVQRAAVEAAVEQAELRGSAAAVFVNLARRTQALVQRQHTVLDGMQRRTEDTEVLTGLYLLDHLTTRMRRHAEGLIVLTGGSPRRGLRAPVTVFDVVRAAASEVENYPRIVIYPFPEIALVGPAVADITHLVAELMENATLYSPPEANVIVSGQWAVNGFTIEIDDRGPGMGGDALSAANLRLSENVEFDHADTERIGLFVVGRLAHRHGVAVTLRRSAYGGICAVVLLPGPLLAEHPSDPLDAIHAAPGASGDVLGKHEDSGGRLPRRVRRKQLAPQLRAQPESDGSVAAPPHSPEQARAVFGAFHRGLEQGRTADRMPGGARHAAPQPTASPAPDTATIEEGSEG
ncbi:nitrate- and nitrite sensing domain-containing protein [Streptomyces sp. NPDC058989]|uniref:nitrate- and nitrite sensing domain-containing protein n=1 Tax=Streptomyces sp. NPDC058989 TaxID=3346686 RepID=UPI003682B4F8